MANEKPFYVSQLPEGVQKKLKDMQKKKLLDEGYSEKDAEYYSDEFLNEKIYTAEEFYGNDFWEKPEFKEEPKSLDAIKDNFTPPGAKDKEPKKNAPSFDAYMDARRTVDKYRDTYKKQKEEYDTAQRMNWAENAKKEGSRLNPMYGLKPNNFEKDSTYQKAVDTINAYEDSEGYKDDVRYLKANPFETMFSEKVEEDVEPEIEKPEVKDIDTNDNGKVEVDELEAYTKDLEDYLDKNPDAKKKNYY